MRSRSRSERRPLFPRCSSTVHGCKLQTVCITCPRVTTTCTRSQMCSTVARLCTGIFCKSVQAAGFLPIPTGKAQQRPALGGSAMGDAAPGGIDTTGTDRAFGHGRCVHRHAL